MSVRLRPAGRLEGREVREAVLQSASARITVLSWGATLRDWRVPVGGAERPATLGLQRIEDHPAHSPAFGAICGRVANRVSNARFHLGGEEVCVTPNLGPHCLHGGPQGLGRSHWEMEADTARTALRLTRLSPDGEGGWPGTVAFEAILALDGPRLTFDLRATPDRPTPINLAQHSYWNLDDAPAAADHRLRLAASRVAETDADLIPTGRLLPVAGPLDFRETRPLRGPGGAPLALDHPFALDPDRDPAAPAAELTGGRGDLRLRLWTDQPSLQVYTAPGLTLAVPGLDGRRYGPFAGVCLEAQNFPDAPNRPEFPDPVHGPDRPYRQVTTVEIAPT